MMKGIFRLIGLAILAAIIFLALSLWQGGKPFRWFGTQTEKAGEVINKKSGEIAKEADKIKSKTEDIRDTTNKVADGLKKTGDTIKDITGAKKAPDKKASRE
jgi:methyl-accepting chemotaxis protein